MRSVLVVLLVAAAMVVLERLRPGRAFPRVARFHVRALALNLLQIGSVALVGKLADPWLREHRPWSADRLGMLGSALLGYLAITFVYYWWHRWRHEVPFLWRWFHQLHHSPQRIEILTSFYKHPLELVVNGLLSSAILYLVVGASPDAAVLAVTMTGLAELFYHWNFRTPRWLTYVIQRPESHLIHHQAGLHTGNFSDLPLWDLLFGTFRSPESFSGACGFHEHELELELELGAMLRGVDVHARRRA